MVNIIHFLHAIHKLVSLYRSPYNQLIIAFFKSQNKKGP